MKTITVWQPWASLLAVGAKRFETRSWPTSYRGPIAIHAATKDPYSIMAKLPRRVAKAIYDVLYEKFGIQSGALRRMSTGCVIATAELIGCHKIFRCGGRGEGPGWIETAQGIYQPDERELLFGDWTPGRYAWEIANVKPLDEPIPAKGQQRLWEWSGLNEGK